MSAKLTMPALACATLLLAACETPTRVIDTSVNSFRAIPYSARDTCETQRAVAEHNAVYDTLKGGKPVTYRPPCELVPAKKPVPAPSAAHQPLPASVRTETEWHKSRTAPAVPEVDPAKARRTG